MTKPQDNPRRPVAGQGELIGPGDVQRPVRKMEQATKDAIEAAQLDPRDKAMGQLAVECAVAVDISNRRLDPYGTAAAARELRETLIRLKLDPVSREGAGGSDEIGKLLAELAELDG